MPTTPGLVFLGFFITFNNFIHVCNKIWSYTLTISLLQLLLHDPTELPPNFRSFFFVIDTPINPDAGDQTQILRVTHFTKPSFHTLPSNVCYCLPPGMSTDDD